jgi:hypothetical protein
MKIPTWRDALNQYFNSLEEREEESYSSIFNSELGLRVDLSHPLRGVTSIKFEASVESLDEIEGICVVQKNFVRVYSITNRGRNLLDTMPIYDFDNIKCEKEQFKSFISENKSKYPSYTHLIDFYNVVYSGLKGY